MLEDAVSGILYIFGFTHVSFIKNYLLWLQMPTAHNTHQLSHVYIDTYISIFTFSKEKLSHMKQGILLTNCVNIIINVSSIHKPIYIFESSLKLSKK